MHAIGLIIGLLLQLYLLLMIVRMIMSWVTVLAPRFEPHGAVLVVFEGVYTLTDPPVKFFSRILPDVRTAGVSFSLGYLAAMLALIVLIQVNAAIFLR